MNISHMNELFTCLIYGEGRRDKDFIKCLINLKKFNDHTKKWVFSYSNASGNSAKDVLEKCHKYACGNSYDLILCFVDLDKLKHDYPKTWQKKKEALEKKYLNIRVIWQQDNAEDEYKRVLGNLKISKKRLNTLAKKEVTKFINSNFWKRILEPIKKREKELS